jgi:hypothetical protein
LLRQVVELLGNGDQSTASSTIPQQQDESLPTSSQASTINTNPTQATTNRPSVAVDEHCRLFNRQSVNYNSNFHKIFVCIAPFFS